MSKFAAGQQQGNNMPGVVVPAAGKPFQRRLDLGMIATIPKVIRELSVYLFDRAQAEEGEEH